MYSSVRESHANFKSRRRKYPISFQPERPNGRFKFKNFCRCFRKEKKSNVTTNFNKEKFDKDDISPILKEITSKFFEKEFNKYFDTKKENPPPEECLSTATFLSTNYFQVRRPIKLDTYPITCNYGNKTFNKGTQYLSASSLQSGVEEKLFTDMKDETTQTEFNLADKITQYSNKFQCNKETNTSNISQKSTMILFANQSKMFESTDDTLKEDEVNETKKNRSVRINLDKDLKKRSCCTSTSDTCIYEEIQNKFFEWLEFVRKDKNRGDAKSILIKPKNEESLKSKPSVYKLRVKTPKKDEMEERKEALSKVAEFLTADNPILTEDIQKSLNKLSGNNREKQRYPTFIGADIKVNDDDDVLEIAKKKRVPKIIIGKKKLKNCVNEDDSIKKVDLEIDAITSKMEKYLEVLLHDDQSSLGSDSIVESNQNEQRMELCPLENQSVCRNTPVTLLHPLLHNIHMKTLNKKDSKKDLKKPLNKIKSEEKKEFKFGNLFKKKVDPPEPKPIIQNQTFNVLNVSSKERGTSCCNKNDLADSSTMAGNSLFISVDKSTNTFERMSQSMGVQTTNNVRNKKLLANSRRNTFHIGVQTNLDDFNQDDENERILYPRDRKVNELDRKKVKEYFFKAKKVVTGLLSKGKYSNSWSNTEEIDEEDSGSVENLNIPLKVKFSNVIVEGDAKDSTTKVINLPEESSDVDDDDENDEGGLSDDEVFRKQTVLSFYTWCFSNKEEDRFLKNEKKMFELTHLGSGDNNFVSPPPTNYFNRLLTYPVITEDVNKPSPRQEKVKIISSKIKKKKVIKKKMNKESKRKKNRNRKEFLQPKIRDISIYSVDNYIQFGSSSSIVDQEFVGLKRSERNLKIPVKIEVTKELKNELINDPTLKEELITTFRPIGPDDIKLIKKESNKNIENDTLLTLKKQLLSSPKIVKGNSSFSSSLENSDIFSDLPSDIIDEILDEYDVLTGENPLIEEVEEPDQDGEDKQKRSWGRLAARYKKMFARKKRSKSKLNLVACCKRVKKKNEGKKKTVKVKRIKRKDESERRWYHFWKPPKIKGSAEDPLDLIEEERPYPFWKDDFEPVLMSGDLVGKTKIVVKPLPRITRAFPKIKEIGESPEDLLLTSSTLLKLTPQREQIEKSNLQLAYGGTPSTRHTQKSLPKNRKQHIYNLQQILPSRNSLVLLHKGPPSLESSTITISERFQITTDSGSSDEFLFRPPRRFPKNNLNELEIIHPKTIYLVSGLRQHISDEMLMVLLRTYMWRRIHKPMIADVEPCLEDAKVEENDSITSLSIFDEEREEEAQKDVEVEETKEDALNDLNLLRELLRGRDKVKKEDVEGIDDGHRYDILVSDDEMRKEEAPEEVVKKIVDDVVKNDDKKEDFVGVDKEEIFVGDDKEEEIKVVDFSAKPKPKNAFEHALSGVGKPILEISDEFRAFLKSIGVFEPPEIKKKKKKRSKIMTKRSVQTSNEFYIEKLNPPLDEGLMSRSKSLPEIKPLSGTPKGIPKSSKIAFKTTRKPAEVKETKKICFKMRPKPKIIKQAPLQPIFHEELEISSLNKENQENEENKVMKYEEKKSSIKFGKSHFKRKLLNEKFLKHLENRKCPKSCGSINLGESSDEIKSKIRIIKSKIRKSAKIEVEKLNKILRNLQKLDSDDKPMINYNDKLKKELKNVVTLKKSQTQTDRFRSKKCPDSCKVQGGIKKSDKFYSKVNQNRNEVETKNDSDDVKESKCLKIYDKVKGKFQNRDEIESKDDSDDVKELRCLKKMKGKVQNQNEIESKDDSDDVKELKCLKIYDKMKGKFQNRDEIETKDASDDVKDSKCLKMYDKMKAKLVKKILEGSIKKSPKFSSSSVTTLNKSSTQTDEESSEVDFNNETSSKPKISNEKKSLRFQDDFDKNDDNFPKSGDSPKSTESSKLLIKIKRNNFDSLSSNTVETRRISETSSVSASTSTEPESLSKRINRPKQNSLGYRCGGVWGNPFYNSNQINNEIKVTSYSSTISDDGNLAQIIKNEVKLINFDPRSSFTSFSSFLSSPSENCRVNRRLLAQEIANDIKKKSELFKRNKTSSSLSEKRSKIDYFNPKRHHVNYVNSVGKLGFLDNSFSVNGRSVKYPSNLIVKEDSVGEETKSNGIKCRLEFIYRRMPIAFDSELGLFRGSREFSEGVSEMKKRKKSPKSFFAEPIECFAATAQVEHIQTENENENENDKENNLRDLYLIKSDTIVRRDDPNGGVSISRSSEDFFCPPQGKKAKTFKANLNNVFKECNDIFQKVKRFHQPMIDPLMKSNVLCVSKKRELNFPMIEDGKKKKKKESKASLNGSDDSKRSKRHKSSKDRIVKDASRETSKDDLDVAKDDRKTESRDSITTVTRRSNPTLSVETDTTRTIESSGPSSLNCDGQCQTEGLCYCKMSKGNNNQIKHSRPIKVMDKEQRDFGNNYQALIKPYTCCIHAKEEGRNYCKKVTFDQMRRNDANSFCTDSSVTSIEAVKRLIGKKKHKYKDQSETKLLNCGKGTIDAVISEEPNSKMSGYVDKKRRKPIHLDRKKKHAEGGSETSSKDTSSTKIPFFRRLFKSKRERSKSRDRSKRRKREKEKEKEGGSHKLPPGIKRLQATYNEKYAALKRRMRKEDGELEFGLCSCPRDEDDVVIVEEGGKKSKKKCCAKKAPPQTKQSQRNELPITTKCACNILEQQSKGKDTPGIQRRPRLIKKRSKSNEVTPKSSQRSILKKKRHKRRSSTQYEEPQDKKLTFKDDVEEENDVNQNVNEMSNEMSNENSSSAVSHNNSKGTHSSKFKPPKKSKKERKLEEQVFSETDPKVIDQKGCVCDDFETFSSIVVRTPDPSEPGCCSMCKKKSSEKSEKHPPKKKASKSKSKSKPKPKHSSEGRLSTSNASKSRVKPKKVEKCEKAEKGSYSTKEDSSKCFCDYEDDEMKKLLLAPHPSMLKTSTKSSPKSSLRSSKKNSFIKPRKARSKGSSRISSEEFVRTHEYDVRHLELTPTLLNIYHKPHKKIPGKDEIFETLISMLFKEKGRNKRGETTRKRMVKKYLSQVSSTELEDIVLELVRSLPNGLEDILMANSKNEEISKKKISRDEIKLNVSKGYLKRFKNQVQLERNVFCSKYSKKVAITCSEDCSCIAEPCSSGVSDVNDDMINCGKADYAIDVDKVEVFCRNCDSWCTLSSSDKDKKNRNQNRLIKEDVSAKNGDGSKEIVELIRLLSNLSPKDLCGFFSKQCMK